MYLPWGFHQNYMPETTSQVEKEPSCTIVCNEPS
jgi:hypothetical protein